MPQYRSKAQAHGCNALAAGVELITYGGWTGCRRCRDAGAGGGAELGGRVGPGVALLCRGPCGLGACAGQAGAAGRRVRPGAAAAAGRDENDDAKIVHSTTSLAAP